MFDHLTPTQAGLAGALVGVVRALDGSISPTPDTYPLLFEGLQALEEGEDRQGRLTHRLHLEKATLAPDCALCAAPCGRTADYDLSALDRAPEAVRAAKLALLAALCRLAKAGKDPQEVGRLVCRGLFLLGYAETPEPLADALSQVEETMV